MMNTTVGYAGREVAQSSECMWRKEVSVMRRKECNVFFSTARNVLV